MFATARQIAYLQDLTDKAQLIKTKHPSLIPQGLMYCKWDSSHLTSEKASLTIQMYQHILEDCYRAMYPWKYKKANTNEDLPL